MLEQIREDEMQASPADGPCSNELIRYSGTQPKIGIKGNLTTLALNCTRAAATVMDKLSIPQLEALHQKMNSLIQESPPGQPEDPTPLCTETHEYNVPSPEFMYQFRGSSGLYVGLEDKVRPDQIRVDRWEQQVRPRLCTDIKEFEKKMRSSRTFRGRGGLSISPELRMSGHVEPSNKVKLSPRIWILYGHERWRKSVQKFVKELEWLSLEDFGEVEVHFGGPRLSALESSSMVLGLDFDTDHVHHLDDKTTLYLHVEEPQGVSACGLACCATIMRGGNIMSQRVSRIGGILCVNGKRFGVTTAHGMLEWFVDDYLNSQVGDVSSDDESLEFQLSSDEEDEGNISATYRKKSTGTGMRFHEPDEATDTNGIHRWSPVSKLGLTSYLQTRYLLPPEKGVIFQREIPEDPQGHEPSHRAALSSDFSLWGFQNTETLQNAYMKKDGQIVTINALGYNATEGPVQLLLGTDGLRQGILLPGTMSFFISGTQFKTRKIRITEPLGKL
ncbi:hypothetical protein NW768_007443 [Fusarium equiseti]|uniref:Uncharacterized protein n=1 Tax=Fusarium equiseti TaxID=61235 RepID=A0ABQ8R7G6_FUSEQ|nr:hypothetical protein NW768_007443 [Fusarium equiseti]